MKPNARFLQSRKSDGKILTGLMFGNPVEITEKKVELGVPLWINIAYEGDFKGHPSSPDGALFDEALFSKLIANFRAHPKFKAGPDGIGSQKVIPTDFEHASEMPATSGTIPTEGAPSPAWIWDLRMVRDPNGRLNLDALTEVTSPKLAQDINTDGYRFTSVAIWGDAVDGVTGKKIGPYLSSFAFTNHSFLPDLRPILSSLSQWGRAESPEEALVGMRDVFGLPVESTIEQVVSELNLFAEMLEADTLTQAVRDMDLVSRIRSLLGLRVLSTSEEVLEAARQMLCPVGYTEEALGGEPNQTQEQSTMSLNSKLAATFKCRDTDESILMAAETTAAAASSSTDALKQLQDMFGAKDFQGLLKAAAEQIAMADKVKGLVEALQAANQGMGQMDEAQAAAETDAVVATITADKTIASRIRPGIFSQRCACLVEQDVCGAKIRRVDDAKLAEFRKTYPLPPADLALLTQRMFAAPGGQQLQMSADSQGRITQAALPPGQRDGDAGDDRTAKIKNFTGRNNTERAMAMLCAERPAFKDMDRLDQVQTAGKWLRGEIG
ncbi:MAG: hypothetical protein WC565_05135 [Parcubacteria group bacterium]